MPNETEKPVLDGQKQHWERMLETRSEMFGSDPSEPGRRSAAEFRAAGSLRILELGGGQGRDSLFFASGGFEVHVLDYAQASVDTILRKAAQAGFGDRIIYTVRNTSDPDFGRGIHRGEDLYENQGFIVHFFDRAKVERLARGYEIASVDEVEEGKLPRRLYRVTLRKPASG